MTELETAVTPTTEEEMPPAEERCALSGEGDFVIENYQLSNISSSCDNLDYPPDMLADPMLLYLAAGGRWAISADTPEVRAWTWQPVTGLEGAIVNAKAYTQGNTLRIEATITAPRSTSLFAPMQAKGNGIALAAMIPLVPLAMKIPARKRRRLVMLALVMVAFLLMAQSCEAYGGISGTYIFPLPEDGFACEIAPENPNLAEMPGSSGRVRIDVSFVEEEGNVTSCTTTATVSGIGILKREGFYTEESLE